MFTNFFYVLKQYPSSWTALLLWHTSARAQMITLSHKVHTHPTQLHRGQRQSSYVAIQLYNNRLWLNTKGVQLQWQVLMQPWMNTMSMEKKSSHRTQKSNITESHFVEGKHSFPCFAVRSGRKKIYIYIITMLILEVDPFAFEHLESHIDIVDLL